MKANQVASAAEDVARVPDINHMLFQWVRGALQQEVSKDRSGECWEVECVVSISARSRRRLKPAHSDELLAVRVNIGGQVVDDIPIEKVRGGRLERRLLGGFVKGLKMAV